MAGEREQRAAAPAHATGAVEFVALAEVAGDETFRLRPDGDVSQLATAVGRLGQLSPIELRPWPGAASDGPRWQVVAGFRRLAATRLLARERVLARLHVELSDDDAWALALGEALLREPLTAAELEALRTRLHAAGVAPWADELVDEALVRAPLPPEQREAFFDYLRGAPPPAAVPEAPAPEREQPEDEQPERTDDSPEAVLAAAAEAVAAAEPGLGPEGAAIPVAAPLGDVVPLADVGAAGEPEVIEVTPEELVEDLTTRLYAINQDLAAAFEAWEDLPAEGRRALVEQARYVVALLPFMEGKE